jgi:putative YhdH/YhfP family quinone oxidoreductase
MPTLPDTFACYLVQKSGKDQVTTSVERRPTHELPQGDVVVRVQYSSLNFKDAMAAMGHPGVAKRFPHVPGIDAAGVVASSGDSRFREGDEVIVTGHGLGSDTWGGWSELVRVPADWVVARPKGLTLREAMILGTAGFTAAQSVWQLRRHDITPDRGPILVTGATGGVGILAVKLLAKLGYEVHASSGKSDARDWLLSHGAAQVLGRDEVNDRGTRPLLSARWAGAVDTVGGPILGTVLRSIRHRGCVTCCGLTAGSDLPVTVYPFILRGITLQGIDSAECPDEPRREIWRLLSSDWKLDNLESIATEVTWAQLPAQVDAIFHGKVRGRTLVRQ